MTISFVVLFDLNSFPPGNDLEVQHKYLKWVQEHILTLASKAASDDSVNDVDYSQLMWSFKFFNSAKDVDYRNKEFEPFTIATFEAFEAALLSEYDRFRAQTANQDTSDLNRSSCLSQALKRITSDLRWEENSGKNPKLHNACYAVLRVPRDEDELIQFTDSNEDYASSPNSRHVLTALLPSAFLKAFHGKYNIQLNFIDTWVLHKHENLEKEWNGQDYSKQIVKVLDYLNHGTVIQLQKSQPAPPGLPSYFTLLKNSLKAATSTSPTTYDRLSEAQKLLKNTKARADSTKLDSSFSSVQTVKTRERRRVVEHKENRGRSNSSKKTKSYPGLMFPDSGKASPDSSTSEDMGSSILGNNQERALSRFILEVNSRKSRYHRMKSQKPRNLQQPSSAPQRKYRRSPPHSGRDSDQVLNGIIPNSWTAQLLSKATDKERKKWQFAVNKEEEERRRVRDERQKVLSDFQCMLVIMKTRLKIYLEKRGLEESVDLIQLIPILKDFKESCLEDESICVLSLSQTVVQFVVEKLQASKIFGQSAQETLEKELFVPIAELRAGVLKGKNDDKELNKVFRECQFQILIRLEASWLLPSSSESLEVLRDEIVDLLSLLAIYIKKPVDDFMSNVVAKGYMETHSELLIRLYREMNMDAPRNLILYVTPSKSIQSRCSLAPSSLRSPFGSTESLFAPPSQVKCKVKQRDPLKREDSFVSQKSSARYASHVYVNNPKKTIMVPVRNVKKFSTGLKSSKPPGRSSRVRRNLFDSDGSKHKTSIQSITRLARSPNASSLKSHGSHLSSRWESLRTKRKLNLDDEDDEESGRQRYSNFASPDMFSPSRVGGSDILCPATPSDKPFNSCKKMKRSSSHKSSSEKIIVESPELPKSGLSKSFSQAVHSLSFYSTGSDSFKSRAWEKSGNKMMAAKIKRTIDSSSFMNSGLTLSDLEIIGGGISSPESKSVDHENFQSPKTRPKKKVPDESPCCSKTLQNVSTKVEVVQANVNANIEALIRSEQSLALLKTTPKGCGTMDTPTKKISFNFDESLIKTPNRGSPGTPKSILKTPNRGDETLKKSARNETDKETPVKPTHFEAMSELPTQIPNPENASDSECTSPEAEATPKAEAPPEVEAEAPPEVEAEAPPGAEAEAPPGAEAEAPPGAEAEAPPGAETEGEITVALPAEVNSVNIPSAIQPDQEQLKFLDLLMNTPMDPVYDQQIFQQGEDFSAYVPNVDVPNFPVASIYQADFPNSVTYQPYVEPDGSNNYQTQVRCNFLDPHHPTLANLTEL